jgi:hypothetical protein
VLIGADKIEDADNDDYCDENREKDFHISIISESYPHFRGGAHPVPCGIISA